MKMQITKEKAYIMGTFKEIGKEVAKMLRKNDDDRKCFEWPKFAYAIAAEGCFDDIHGVSLNSTGWYGMDEVDDKFDSDNIATIIANYYGGGCAVALNLWIDEITDVGYTAESISHVMKSSLEMQEAVNDSTVIIAEWKIEDFVDIYEIVETCPHCDHENRYTKTEIINGHAARCKNCGRIIFLCSNCDFCGNGCGWHEIPNGCECAVGKIVEIFIKK